jgi:RimJ/RimL family protein N-acetyltransferase
MWLWRSERGPGNLAQVPFGPKFVGERVLLRDATPSDVEARQRLGRHAEIERMFGAEHPVSGALTQRGAEFWLSRLGSEGTIEWVVENEGSLLGTARLHSFDEASARYAVGFLDPARLGKGYGTEVTELVLEYAFGEVGLERVTLAVLGFNERAIRCYRHSGFREVGRIPEAAVIDGQRFEDIVMAVTADEFRRRS